MSAEDGSRIADLVLTTNDGNPECYVLRHRSGEYEEYPSLGKAIVAMAILGEYEQIDPPYEYSSLSWAINNGHWRTEVHGAWVKVEKKKNFGPAAFFAAMAALHGIGIWGDGDAYFVFGFWAFAALAAVYAWVAHYLAGVK